MKNKKEFLKEIQEYIPSAAQTLSKFPGQYVIGVTPVAIREAKGVYLTDHMGDQYFDLVLALGPMVFGYANERIDTAVKAQIDRGTIFSLASEKELELAKLLREVLPCGEMSKFFLNGNDATSGAVRLARHITKRDHIAKCGYHGCQDWSVCTKDGRNAGVPEILKTLTHDFTYNDISSLEKIFADYPDQIAAVILEPTSSEKPQDDFLKKVKELAHKHGAILIFDEMVTGFRWALGGAAEYFGITPDLACYGKAISNGYPLSVLSGKAEYMKRMDEVFVSMTFGGYVPGIVAAIETITMMKELGDVQKTMHARGEYFMEKMNEVCKEYGLPIEFIGYGPHPVMKINLDDYSGRVLKTFVYQEMNKKGILFSSSIMIGYIHTQEQLDGVVSVFREIAKRVSQKKLPEELLPLLEGEVVAPRTVRPNQ